MDNFILNIFCVINKIGFSPIVLIGLLIASLSLILNLKSTNIYLQKFKNHSNIDKFINLIFYTSFDLLCLFLIFVISPFIEYFIAQFIISIIYLLLLIYLLYSLFTIVFILKEIVRISLKN